MVTFKRELYEYMETCTYSLLLFTALLDALYKKVVLIVIYFFFYSRIGRSNDDQVTPHVKWVRLKQLYNRRSPPIKQGKLVTIDYKE